MPDEYSISRYPNPYDFRNPTHPDRLVGREGELASIDKHMQSTSRGRPVHVALIGERAAGKTSLLRAAERKALDSKLVPVRVDLDESAVGSPFTFFKAIFEAVVHSFVALGILESTDTRVDAWHRQVLVGDTHVDPQEQLILFGMLAASVINGATHYDVSPALLKADCDALIALAEAGGFRGIVLLLDEGDLIGENPPLIQKLRNLFQSVSRWMLIAAGTSRMFSSLSEVFSPIPRQFERISVGPFTSPYEVRACITAPLRELPESLAEVLRPKLEAVEDIRAVTRGKPYEINLICYFIWEAIQGEIQDEFELSPFVLDQVLGELTAIGREMAVNEIEAIRHLSSDHLETAIDIVPYEGLGIEELALVRLLPRDFADDEFRREIKYVRDAIKDLEAWGIIEVEDDRFRLRGDSFVRIYFKYRASRYASTQMGRHVSFEGSYISIVHKKFRQLLHEFLLGEQLPQAAFFRAVGELEYGDHQVGREFRKLAEAFESKDASAIASSSVFSSSGLFEWSDFEKASEHGLILVGLVFVFGLSCIEYASVAFNKAGIAPEELRSKLELWLETQRPILLKYRGDVEEHVTGVLDPETTHAVMVQADEWLVARRAVELYGTGEFTEALELLQSSIDILQPEIARHGDGPRAHRYRGRLADLKNRFGFIASVAGQYEDALAQLEEALELRTAESWLHQYNAAYAHACLGRYKEAAEFAEEASRKLNDEINSKMGPGRERFVAQLGYMMLAYFPTPDSWVIPRSTWCVVNLRGEQLLTWLRVQSLTFQCLAGSCTKDAFSNESEAVDVAEFAEAQRLLAWTLLTCWRSPEKSLELFKLASKDPASAADASNESQFVRTFYLDGPSSD